MTEFKLGVCSNQLVTCEFYDRLMIVNWPMKQLRLNPVRDAVFSAIHADLRAEALQEFLKNGADIFIMAGALRDAIAAYYGGEGAGDPRDFDVAVANISREIFDEVLSPLGRRNRHGGYVLSILGTPNWDVWRLEETIGLKKTGASCSLENVLRSFNLNCNAVALNIRTGLFLDAGAIDAIRHQRLGFAEDAIRHSTDTFAAKALLLHLRSGYHLTEDMERFIAANLHSSSLLYETAKVFPDAAALPIPYSPES
jgi:hypothetical protein